MSDSDEADDLTAIESSFAALRDDAIEPLERTVDERARHLEEVWQR